MPKLPEFNTAIDMAKPKFNLGLSFPSGAVFKKAVREYSIQNRKDIFFKKNGPHRVRAQCKGVNYPWYLEEFKINEKLGVSSFVHKVNKDHVLDITRDKAYKARLLATKAIEGSYEEQYDALWDYVEEIKNTNRGSIVEFLTEPSENGKPRFKRMYLCFAGLREGFNGGCRPMIGLDGAHIKGVHPGQLLIGIDGNNQMYPVDIAVVEIENKDSWSWFPNLLRVDLIIENSNHWTFITDKQKGLEQALKGMWDEGIPEAEHRHCARHLEKNFIKVFMDKILKDLLWKATREVTVRRFEVVMKEIRMVNEATYEWLMAIGLKH
ncbi:uncharacterized protein LOC133792102 [Humulus lupulus]|uniref:uncharacterized protein LOC133792102 n=1 Tax=Humulus lupulus TaxID=3486 RepID=UPI002B4011BC|nr:uncharacterized protein LOC133792102 [Humulus lupulus]